MLTYNGQEVYPLQISKICLGDEVIYDRANRQRSWFIVDLITDFETIIADDGTVRRGEKLPLGLMTADGKALYTSDGLRLLCKA